MLINLSNHPIEGILDKQTNEYKNKWDPKQLETALVKWQEIVHLPFPNIPPTASYFDVKKMAEEYTAKCLSIFETYPNNGERCVFLTGEVVFCSIISQMLLNHSIRVVSATSERITIELDNGEFIKKFQFVSFRDYGIPIASE